jgi:ribosomal protein S2
VTSVLLYFSGSFDLTNIRDIEEAVVTVKANKMKSISMIVSKQKQRERMKERNFTSRIASELEGLKEMTSTL